MNEGRQEPEVRKAEAEVAVSGGSALDPALRKGSVSLGHIFLPSPATCQGASPSLPPLPDSWRCQNTSSVTVRGLEDDQGPTV